MFKLKWFCDCGHVSPSMGDAELWINRRASTTCHNPDCGKKLISPRDHCVIDEVQNLDTDDVKFFVVGRHEAESDWFHKNLDLIYPDAGKHIWISSHDVGTEEPNLPQHPDRVDHLVQAYDDIDFLSEHYTPMSLDQGMELMTFVRDNLPQIDSIIVNCEVGMCRSSATASALSKALNGHDSGISESYWFIPNTWVYECLYSFVGILDD